MTKDEKKAAVERKKILREKIRSTTKDEKKAAVCISKRKKKLCEKIRLKNGLLQESMRTTLMKAARNDRMFFKFSDLQDSFPAIGVSIGGYSRFTGKDVTVTAFFSYGKRQLNWDITEGPLRHRLRVRWDDINRLELKLNETGLACLSVEVKRTPTCWKFYPNNSWSNMFDFTDGEIRRNLPPHFVLFKPGTIDKSYEKLLNYVKGHALLCEKKKQRYQEFMLAESLGRLSTSEESSPSPTTIDSGYAALLKLFPPDFLD